MEPFAPALVGMSMTEVISNEDGKGGATVPGEDAAAVSGWGVFRRRPWDFAGVFPSRAEAVREQEQRAGSDYEVAFGTAHIGSDRFDVADPQPSQG